jgi:Zn finger protein HypA/HybF involved in hydrogenase expression
MIDRQHGKIQIECDSCDEVYRGESTEFAEVWRAAKLDGWQTRKIAEEWLHGCPKCGAPT